MYKLVYVCLDKCTEITPRKNMTTPNVSFTCWYRLNLNSRLFTSRWRYICNIGQQKYRENRISGSTICPFSLWKKAFITIIRFHNNHFFVTISLMCIASIL